MPFDQPARRRIRTFVRLPVPSVVAIAAVLVLATLAIAEPNGPQRIGRQPDGSVVTSVNQTITPAGRQVEFPGRPVAVALNPANTTAAFLNGSGDTAGLGSPPLVIADTHTGTVVQSFDPSGVGASFDGLAYSPDGRKLYASTSESTILATTVAADGSLTMDAEIALPTQKSDPYPGGMALSADASTLYVALNRSNTLGVIDTGQKKLLAEIPVGNAPYGVVVSGNTAFVSNQAGRRAQDGDFTNQSSGTAVVADPRNGGPVSGTVSVVDLGSRSVVDEIPVGLQPTAMTLDDGYLFVANTNSDTVSVIDPSKRKVVSTINVQPFAKAPYGSAPNGLAMLPGHRLVVSLGRNNALAVYTWAGPLEPARFQGLLPTGWYPSSLAYDARNQQIVVANDKGVGSLGPVAPGQPRIPNDPKIVSANAGSASLIPDPAERDLESGTRQVIRNNGWDRLDDDVATGAASPARAVPRRIGDPSPITHVFYVIKENRTYDQILGDDPRGDGDPALAQFGAAVTPNQHRLVLNYPLLDNFYDSGSLSADGHQWATQAYVDDYLEKSFTDFVRSYPYDGGDALAYSPTGFIWENAIDHGRSVRVYGEYANHSDATGTRSDVPSLDPLLVRAYPRFDLSISDTTRVNMIIEDLVRAEQSGDWPNLTLIQLPLDHTVGSAPDAPTPAAEVADNDWSVGRLVDAVSHSRFWASSAIFVVEDDSQAGVDHVDGHRTTAYLASPYAKRGVVDSTYFTQINLVRTIEQILGLPPMNQMDLAAHPMYSVFTDTADLTPFTAVSPRIGLEMRNPPLSALTGVERAWAVAARSWQFGRPDETPEELLNRDIWYSVRGFATPYPGDGRVLTPQQVRARFHIVPGAEAEVEEEPEG